MKPKNENPEIMIPAEPADFLEPRKVTYTGGPLVLHDGVKVDLNAPSPFADEPAKARRRMPLRRG